LHCNMAGVGLTQVPLYAPHQARYPKKGRPGIGEKIAEVFSPSTRVNARRILSLLVLEQTPSRGHSSRRNAAKAEPLRHKD